MSAMLAPSTVEGSHEPPATRASGASMGTSGRRLRSQQGRRPRTAWNWRERVAKYREGRPPGLPEGRIRFGVVLTLLVVASAGYLGSKFVPPYWTYLSLLDPVKEAALAVAMRQRDEATVRSRLIAQAGEEGLVLTDEDIEFSRDGLLLAVRVSWVVPVDLPRYRYNLRFRIEQTARLP